MIDFTEILETLKSIGIFVGAVVGVYFFRGILFNTFRNGVTKLDKVLITILIVAAVVAALIIKFL